MAEITSTLPEAMEIDSTAPAEAPAVDAAPAVDTASTSAEQPAQQDAASTQNDSPMEDSTAEQPAERSSISKRVQQGKAYNNRDSKSNGRDAHGKGDRKYNGSRKNFDANVKTKLVREEESSDAVEIRKQVLLLFQI